MCFLHGVKFMVWCLLMVGDVWWKLNFDAYLHTVYLYGFVWKQDMYSYNTLINHICSVFGQARVSDCWLYYTCRYIPITSPWYVPSISAWSLVGYPISIWSRPAKAEIHIQIYTKSKSIMKIPIIKITTPQYQDPMNIHIESTGKIFLLKYPHWFRIPLKLAILHME